VGGHDAMNEFFQDTGTDSDPLYEKLKKPENSCCLKARNLVEHMWTACGHLVDKNLRKNARLDFSAAWWELYLAFALTELGISVVPYNSQPRFGKGRPDIVTKKPRVWIEAVTPEAGRGPDALTEPQIGTVFDVPVEAFILRLRNSIQNKRIAIDQYILNGTIPVSEPIIIAISGARLPFRFTEGPTPNIVRAVFGIGNLVLELDTATMKHLDTSLEHREHVVKKSNKVVSTDLFLHKEYEHITAILYSASDCVNHPTQPGRDFVLAHNPNALVRLPESWLPAADQFWIEGCTLRRVPSAFEQSS
jgi:hypothetical protein